MIRFAQLPEAMHEALSVGAGVVLAEFDPVDVPDKDTVRDNLLFATTGGLSVSCAMTTSDFGSDIDNCPKNTKELLRVESWECVISGTALTLTAENVKRICNMSTVVTANGLTEVTPRHDVSLEDFKTMWLVCNYGTEGGFVAVKLTNALNTGGFSMNTADEGKAQFPFSFTGFSSIDNPTEVPFKFFINDGTATVEVEPNV